MPDIEPYTEDHHLEGLKIVLTSNEPCSECPAFELARKLYPDEARPHATWSNDECVICANFIAKHLEYKHPIDIKCPCKQYGQADSINLTHIVIELFFPETWKEILETLENPEEN